MSETRKIVPFVDRSTRARLLRIMAAHVEVGVPLITSVKAIRSTFDQVKVNKDMGVVIMLGNFLDALDDTGDLAAALKLAFSSSSPDEQALLSVPIPFAEADRMMVTRLLSMHAEFMLLGIKKDNKP